MRIWFVTINKPKYGLNTTLHRYESDAIHYLMRLYAVPDSVHSRDALDWIGANTEDEILIDYDEVEV